MGNFAIFWAGGLDEGARGFFVFGCVWCMVYGREWMFLRREVILVAYDLGEGFDICLE